jgi:anti-sigma-K factor RskA
MMSHDEMLDGVAAYALGALPEKEAALITSHLQSCKECRDEYRLLRPAVTAVAYTAEACTDLQSGAVVASPLLKARVMKQVREGTVRRPQRRGWAGRAAIWAVVAACLALAVVDFSMNERVNRDRALLAAQDQTIADLAAADAKRYRFGNGEVLTHGDRLYIALRDLPTPPRGKIYQAWTLAKGEKRVAPSVTFEPSGGTTLVRLPEAATAVAAVAVSVEPEGGSTQPTTKPIAVVNLRS